MALVQDLFLTAVIAVLLSCVIAKLVSMAMGGDSSHDSQSTPNENVGREITQDVDEEVIMEELQFRERLEIEFVGGVTEKVELVGESVPVEEVVESVNQNETINTELGQKSMEEEEKLTEEVLEKKGGEFEKEMNLETRGSEELALDDKGIVDGQQSEELRDVKSGSKEETGEKKIETDVDDDDDEDDWEGIERSELEKLFVDAAKFMESKERDGSFGSDVQMELYGLHKVATEGPCRQQPPIALMVSARAKWNAWQRLGNMNPDEAMEQYIALVSDRVPGWMEDKPIGDGKPESSEATNHGAAAPAFSSFSSSQPDSASERNPELKLGEEKSNLTEGSNLETGPKNDEHYSAA